MSPRFSSSKLPLKPLERRLSEIYGEADGFDIPTEEERAVRQSRGNPLYGELTARGTRTLLDVLELGARDVFYDLGSGLGKVVLQVAMQVQLRRCVGYELSTTRCRLARSALRKAREHDWIFARRTVFYASDFLQAPMEDATAVYSCSTAFSNRFMKKIARRLLQLPRPVRFLSLQSLDPTRGIEEVEELRLHTTWNARAPAYLYQVTPRGK